MNYNGSGSECWNNSTRSQESLHVTLLRLDQFIVWDWNKTNSSGITQQNNSEEN